MANSGDQQQTKPRAAPNAGWWVDALYQLAGELVNLETLDGVTRGGRLTGIRSQEYRFNGRVFLFPRQLELNGDPNDLVPIDRLASIEKNSRGG